MTIRPHNCITIIVPGSEEIVSAVFVILLMFCAVIVMVIRVDNNRENSRRASTDSRVTRN